MLASIKKRDSRLVPFDVNKIAEAVFRAAGSQGGTDRALARTIADLVVAELERDFSNTIPEVEQVQDLV